MGRKANPVTGSTEAGATLIATAVGIKRTREATAGEKSAIKKSQQIHDVRSMLNAPRTSWNGSPSSSTASTIFGDSSCLPTSPASTLETSVVGTVLDNDTPSAQDPLDRDFFDAQLEEMKRRGERPFSPIALPTAACGSKTISPAHCPLSVTGSPEAGPSTSLSAASAVHKSWTDRLSEFDADLAEPEPQEPARSIGTSTDGQGESRRWAQLADEGFELRSGPGQKFQRDPVSKSVEYKSLRTPQKAEFRKQWAKNIYESIRNVKVKSQKWSQIDVSKGTYMPFRCIVREEGDDDQGLTAAVNYVSACQKMGGVWKKFNMMTKRWEFLHMRQEVHEIFEQSWKVFEESTHDQEPGALAPDHGAKAVHGSTEAAVEPDGKQTEKQKTKKGKEAVTGSTEAVDTKGNGQGKKPRTPDTKKNPFEIAMQDALVTRKLYMTVTSKAALVTEQIKSNEAWLWARGFYESELQKIFQPIQQLATTGFARLFLMQELKDVKNNYCQNDLLTHTLKFSSDFDDVLSKAQKLLGTLTSMQSESMK
jgi:hypothetical protein